VEVSFTLGIELELQQGKWFDSIWSLDLRNGLELFDGRQHSAGSWSRSEWSPQQLNIELVKSSNFNFVQRTFFEG
jgi:hypothetical protein